MHSKSALLQDVVVKVQAHTLPGETVCISGSSPELGQWQVSKAIILTKTCSEGEIWSGVIRAPVDRAIQYRYVVCIVLDTEVQENCVTQDVRVREEHIVRRWESHLRPRVLSPSDIENGKTSLSTFGIVDGIGSIESGWLTSETVVQLKLFNNPVTIWKRRLRDKQLSIHVSTIEISRRDSEVHPFLEEDSTLTEGNPTNNWPVVEVAVMNEVNWQFSPQTQFGYVYEPGDYLTFQAQMIDPETIASNNVLTCINQLCFELRQGLSCLRVKTKLVNTCENIVGSLRKAKKRFTLGGQGLTEALHPPTT